jgi:hypothetical protein
MLSCLSNKKGGDKKEGSKHLGLAFQFFHSKFLKFFTLPNLERQKQ